MIAELTPCIYRAQANQDHSGCGFSEKDPKTGKPSSAFFISENVLNKSCGVCKLLTLKNLGPVACNQPHQDENTCPAIEGARVVNIK